jgi:hypothetical protein
MCRENMALECLQNTFCPPIAEIIFGYIKGQYVKVIAWEINFPLFHNSSFVFKKVYEEGGFVPPDVGCCSDGCDSHARQRFGQYVTITGENVLTDLGTKMYKSGFKEFRSLAEYKATGYQFNFPIIVLRGLGPQRGKYNHYDGAFREDTTPMNILAEVKLEGVITGAAVRQWWFDLITLKEKKESWRKNSMLKIKSFISEETGDLKEDWIKTKKAVLKILRYIDEFIQHCYNAFDILSVVFDGELRNIDGNFKQAFAFITDTTNPNPGIWRTRYGRTSGVSADEQKMQETLSTSGTIRIDWVGQGHTDVYLTATLYNSFGRKVGKVNYKNNTSLGVTFGEDNICNNGGDATDAISFDPRKLNENDVVYLIVDVAMYNRCATEMVSIDFSIMQSGKIRKEQKLFWFRDDGIRKPFHTIKIKITDYLTPVVEEVKPTVPPYRYVVVGKWDVNPPTPSPPGGLSENAPDGDVVNLVGKKLCCIIYVFEHKEYGLRSPYQMVKLGQNSNGELAMLRSSQHTLRIGSFDGHTIINTKSIPVNFHNALIAPTVFTPKKLDYVAGWFPKHTHYLINVSNVSLFSKLIRDFFPKDVAGVIAGYFGLGDTKFDHLALTIEQ